MLCSVLTTAFVVNFTNAVINILSVVNFTNAVVYTVHTVCGPIHERAAMLRREGYCETSQKRVAD